jgi:hypothetical protein
MMDDDDDTWMLLDFGNREAPAGPKRRLWWTIKASTQKQQVSPHLSRGGRRRQMRMRRPPRACGVLRSCCGRGKEEEGRGGAGG